MSRRVITLDHSLAAGRARLARIMREDRRMSRRERWDLAWHCFGLLAFCVVGIRVAMFFGGIN